MSAEEYRRRARHSLALAQQITNAEDRAAMIAMAAYWKERADQTQPQKEPEGEPS